MGAKKAIHPSSSEIVRKQFRVMQTGEKIKDGKVTDCTEKRWTAHSTLLLKYSFHGGESREGETEPRVTIIPKSLSLATWR